MEDYRLEQTGQEVQDILNGAAMQAELAAETERAIAAEQQLQGNIDAEELARQQADAALQEYADGKVSEEAAARQQADELLQGNIDAEEFRAKAAEAANATAIETINGKIPAEASAENKLVDNAALQGTYYTKDAVDNLIQGLGQNDVIVGALPASGVANTIYRVPGDGVYSDYMWYDGAWQLLATYSANIQGYQYIGIATPTTNPGTPSNNVFYFAHEAGTYTNFGALAVTQGINILKFDGTSWTLEQLVGIDVAPTAGSENLVESGAVKDVYTDIVGQDSNFLNNRIVQPAGNIANYNGLCVSAIIPVNAGDLLEWFIGSFNNDPERRLGFYNSLETTGTTTFVKYYSAYVGTARTLTVPADAVCVRFTFDAENIDKTWLSVNGKKVYIPLISKIGIINEKISELKSEVNARIDAEETKIDNLSLVYDSTVNDILEKQSGTIYTSGALTSTNKYYRWFVKNNSFSKIIVCAKTATSFAQVAFYNSETPSADTLIEGQSYAGSNAKKIYALNVPEGCKLIGFSCLVEVYEDYFYYKIYTQNLIFDLNFQAKVTTDVTDLQTQITNNNTNLQNQITNLEVAYDKDSFKRESGTILANGNRSTSDNYVRWFIKNNNYKHITTYARTATSMLCLAFYDSAVAGADSLIIGYSGTSSKKVYDYDIPENCVLIGVATYITTLTEAAPFYLKIYLNELTPITNQINSVESDLKFKIGNNSSIISLNSPLDMGLKLSILSKNKTALTLAHFSDIHDDKVNLLRFIEFRDKYSDYINDSICTGDLAWNLYTDSPGHPTFSSFWDEVDGTSNILVTIGNHETALTANNWSTADAVDVYNKFMKRCVENPVNNVVHEGTKNYYYKDYASQGIRLIVLDPYYDLDNQNTWLQGVLADALSNDLSVICAEHNPFAYIDFIDCSFTAARFAFGGDTINSSWGNMIAPFVASVDAFQNNDGKFICWIAGHVHSDIVSVHHNYPNQLMLSASCATHEQSAGNSNIRTTGTKNQDNFNIYSFDTALKVITVIRIGQDTDAYMRHRGSLCISYDTKEVLWND